jgi:hypothetical protein
MTYRIIKQFLPIDNNQSDPNWEKRQIWVQKLNDDDTFDDFDTLEEAEVKKQELEAADPTGRVYKIIIL